MAFDAFAAVPGWIYQGALVGALCSLCVAATFVVASRVFPDGNENRGVWTSTEDRRRAEIRRYLDAIDERFTEEATVSEESVAFYLPDRDVAVTFDARTFLALEHAPTYGILAEHELPGVALGPRLPFETPDDPVRRDGDGPDSERGHGRMFDSGAEGKPTAAAAFAVLGVPDTADVADVQRAYRDRIKEVHPDHGGDEDEFLRVREAYDTARHHVS